MLELFVCRPGLNGARLLNGQTKLNGISITPIGPDGQADNRH